jgi:hypothetical protein
LPVSYFACATSDHPAATRGEYTTAVTKQGRLAWSDGNGPPRINRIHHREELLNDEDP